MSTPSMTATKLTAALDTVETAPFAIELPSDVLDWLGPREFLPERFRQAVILHLLREGEISQGTAARLLSINRWDLMDLAVKHQISSGPQTAAEMDAELGALERYAQTIEADAGRQR